MGNNFLMMVSAFSISVAATSSNNRDQPGGNDDFSYMHLITQTSPAPLF